MEKLLPRIDYKETIELAIAKWCWDSHYWIEEREGCYKCKWCGDYWTNGVPIMDNYNNLCKENPIIKEFFSN